MLIYEHNRRVHFTLLKLKGNFSKKLQRIFEI
jgi:hypothetical protein